MTRHRLKQAALLKFSEAGYEAASLADIAKEVGIKTPSIYSHFASKQALLLEIWEDLLTEYSAHMTETIGAAGQMPVKEGLRHIVTQYGRFFKEDTIKYYFWGRLLMFPPPEFKERILGDTWAADAPVFEKIYEIASAGIEQGVLRDVAIEDIASAVAILKEGYISWLIFYDPQNAAEQTERLWNLFWNGLGR
ncbi:MAG: TetR/AcrR family transcriptional regulator [Candidatus Saccharibacteria bacterium]